MPRRHWVRRSRPLSHKPHAVASRKRARVVGALFQARLAERLPSIATATDAEIDTGVEEAYRDALALLGSRPRPRLCRP